MTAAAWDQLTFVAAWAQLGDADRSLFAECWLSQRRGEPLPELPGDDFRREMILTVLDWRPADDAT